MSEPLLILILIVNLKYHLSVYLICNNRLPQSASKNTYLSTPALLVSLYYKMFTFFPPFH